MRSLNSKKAMYCEEKDSSVLQLLAAPTGELHAHKTPLPLRSPPAAPLQHELPWTDLTPSVSSLLFK